MASASPSSTPVGFTLRCAGTQLALKLGVIQGAGGDNVATFRLVNTSDIACHLQGFPGFTLRGSQSADVVAVRNSAERVGYIPTPYKPVPIVLRPGGYAEFAVEGSDYNAVANQLWPNSTSAVVYAPDTTLALTVAVKIPMPQHPSQITVSPVEPAGCIEKMSC